MTLLPLVLMARAELEIRALLTTPLVVGLLIVPWTAWCRLWVLNPLFRSPRISVVSVVGAQSQVTFPVLTSGPHLLSTRVVTFRRALLSSGPKATILLMWFKNLGWRNRSSVPWSPLLPCLLLSWPKFRSVAARLSSFVPEAT